MIFLFLFFLFGKTDAQVVLKTTVDTSSVKKQSIGVKVRGAGKEEVITYKGSPMDEDSVAQALKIDPTLLLRGEFPILYEQRLGDAFSFGLGLGITWTDYIYEFAQNGGRFLGQEKKDVRFRGGSSVRLNTRWYPSRYSTAISGHYLELGAAWRYYRMDYYVNTGLIRIPRPIKRTWYDFTLCYGFQNADKYAFMFWDAYVGLGIRSFNEDRIARSGLNAEITNRQGARVFLTAGIRLAFGL
ncbi:MAG: hypothetical protein ACRCYO_19355 [Bacteroidia bacterium]